MFRDISVPPLATISDLSNVLLGLPTPIAKAVAIIMRPGIIIVSRISMGLVMKIPKGTMIGTVLTTTVKTVLVGTFVRVRQLVVEPIVRVVAVAFVIVSQSGHHGHAQYHGGRKKEFS
jgi:hypothetical protein